MRRLLLLPAALFTLAGCGEDENGGNRAETRGEATLASDLLQLTGAANRTTAEGTSRIELEGSIELEGLEEPIDFRGEGAADFGAGTSRVTLDMSELAEASPAYGPSENWRGEVYYEGEAVFVRLPAISVSLPEAREWVKVDAETLQELGGAQFSAPDPDEFLHFAGAAGSPETLGEEQIRGVETTHLRAEVRVDDLPTALPPERRKGMEAYARRLSFAGLDSFPLDVWVDGDGIIRRLRAEYDNMETGTKEADMSFAMELYDLGEDIVVKPPSPDRVSDIADLIGRGAEEAEEAEVVP
jgi:hypothetical protein